MIPWRVELLGGLRLKRGDIVVERFRTRKTGALLALLAYCNRSQARETLIEQMWPDGSLESGRNQLRVALSTLRSLLEKGTDERGAFVYADRSLAALTSVETDVAELEKWLREAAIASDRVPVLERALELYRGPLLAGFYESWIPIAAARAEALAAGALETLIVELQARGEGTRALQWAHHGATVGLPGAQERLQNLQSSRGASAQKIAAPAATADAAPTFLSRFFGREAELEHLAAWWNLPQTATQERAMLETVTHEAVTREAVTHEAATHEAATHAQEAFNSRSARSATLARDVAPRAAAQCQLANPAMAPLEAARAAMWPWLLTLVGPGGAGKTRLASESLARARRNGNALAVWVPLEGLSDAARLDEALVKALGVEVPPARAPLDCALENLPENLVLCFDNFEHLLPAGALWLGELKRRAPQLRCLATSRCRLQLEGEEALEIGALALPQSAQADAIVGCAAAALFLDRTRAVCSDWHSQRLDSALFARLLRLLDGLPLALELAAARAGVLTPAQMIARLERDADLPLAANARAPRHRSLSATLSWSLGLLEPAERALLARLSLFRGPFDAEAACALMLAEHECDDAAQDEITRQIGRLRDASLLRGVPATRGVPDQRFVLLETVRAGARRLLDGDERGLLMRDYALYFAGLAERAEADIKDGWEWNLRLSALWPDLSAALDWAARREQIAIGLRLASALWRFWLMGGRLAEGLAHLEKLLELAERPRARAAAIDAALGARAATVAGFLALQGGEYDAAERHLIRAVEWAGEDARHRGILAWAFNLRGTGTQRQGKAGAACEYFARSLELYGDDAPPHQRAVARTALAGAQVADGQIEAARANCRRARALWRALDDRHSQGWVEEIEGRAALLEGDARAARAHLEASLELRRGSKTGELAAQGALGEVALLERDFARARAHYQAAILLARELGLRPALASALLGAGRAAHALGDNQDARLAWQESLVLWNAIGDTSQARACRQELKALSR